MNIKVLGVGCARCQELEKRTKAAVADLGVAADVQKVTEIKDIMAFKVMGTPALVVDDRVVSSGRVPSVAEIKEWIEKARPV